VTKRRDPSRVPAVAGGTPVRTHPLAFFRASITDGDIAAVVEALRSGWLTVGPRTERLERMLGDYLGVAHAVAVSSCSEAMFLALRALGVGPGQEVVTSANTFASTVSAIIHVGATPVLADIDPLTLGPDPDDVARRMSAATGALLPVHFGGQACRIAEIVELAARRGLPVVEDAAHSFGAAVDGRLLGALGTATAFSFYATKNLTTGEGGAVTTDDGDLAERLRRLSYHGMSRDSWTRYADRGSWYYEVLEPGFKCNMSDVLAALGVSQLGRADTLLEQRRVLARRYLDRFADSPWIDPPAVAPGNTHTWHLFTVRLRLERLRIDRNRFVAALTEENVGSSVHFIPIYRHPFFARYGVGPESFPACEDYYARCISLPLYPDMSDSDVDDVVEAVQRIAEYHRAD